MLLEMKVFSQENNHIQPEIESAEVQWLGQFPTTNKNAFKKKHGIGYVLGRIAGINNTTPVQFNKPMSVVASNPTSIWVLDQGNANVFAIKNNLATVPKVFTRQKFNFQSLVSICSFSDRGFLFTDSRMNKIFQLSADQKSVRTFSDSIAFKQPTGIAFSAVKNEIWVVETAAHCVTILDENGNKKRSFGKRGAGDGEFNFPTSIWIDKTGWAYIVDALNYRIQLFDENGNFILAFGQAGNVSGSFSLPKGIATDSYGNIYVTDALFHLVQIFNNKGQFLYSFGAQGREQGQFWMPAGIFIDPSNNIYVADSYNSRIQIFSLVNIVTKK